MAKKKGSSKRGRSSGEGWSEDTHTTRKMRQQNKIMKKATAAKANSSSNSSSNTNSNHNESEDVGGGIIANTKEMERERRSALLTRDSKEKREAGKLKLHIKRIQRQVQTLRERLERWDDVEEARVAKETRRRQEEEQKRLDDERAGIKRQKRGRLGPESWKLKGAARPAWQVYDFDTRYVDPYMKDHEEAKKKAARSRNVMVLCKGRFGEEQQQEEKEGHEKGKTDNVMTVVPQPHCRDFLSLLMQLGNLAMQAQQLKTARSAFIEAMELDSIHNPITPARCHLMRMYVDNNRPESARRLWEKLPSTDSSVWIRYSAALIEFVSWNVLEEDGSTQETAELRLLQAIKANVFCAYYLAFFDAFSEVMDYTDDIEDADETTPIMEAIEYCNSEQFGAWAGTDGALDWLKSILLRVLNGEEIVVGEFRLQPSDVEWRKKLNVVREGDDHQHSMVGTMIDHTATEDENEEDEDDDDGADEDEGSHAESVGDVAMYTGMFETGLEMLESAGALKQA